MRRELNIAEGNSSQGYVEARDVEAGERTLDGVAATPHGLGASR
jgi:hypothetical protein